MADLIVPLFFKKPDVGAYNSAFAAASPLVRKDEVSSYKGAYIEGVGRVVEPSEDARDWERAEELWRVTVEFVKRIGVDEV